MIKYRKVNEKVFILSQPSVQCSWSGHLFTLKIKATVITNLLSAIPWIGKDLVEFIWGGFSVLSAPQDSDILLQILLIAGNSSTKGVGYGSNNNI